MAKSSLLPSIDVVHAFHRAIHIVNLPRRLKGVTAKRSGESVFVVVRQMVAGLVNGATSIVKGVARARGLVRGTVHEDVIYRTLASKTVHLWELLPRLGSKRNTYDDDLLIIDDTPLPKPRAKRMAGLSFHYSTTARKTVHGLCMVGLYQRGTAIRGFVGAHLKIGSKSKPGTGRRGRPSLAETDARRLTKPMLALKLVKKVIKAGNRAKHVAFDSAYFGRPLLNGLRALGLTCYTRAKANNVFWIDGVKIKALPWAKEMRSYKLYRNTDIAYSSAIAEMKGFGPVKLVRVRYLPTGEKKTDYAVLVCTDPTVSACKIIERYLKRWSVEVGFRNAKSECGLEKVHVRSFLSIQNYLATSLFTLRVVRLMQHLIGRTRISVPRLVENLRLAIQGVFDGNSLVFCGVDGESMISTAISTQRPPGTMIRSGVQCYCGT